MTAKIIDGKAIAQKIADKIRTEVTNLEQEQGIKPKLTVIIVGKNPASQVYVRNKKIACEKVGMLSDIIELDEQTPENKLLEVITALNADKTVHGILVQLPLPKHINEEKIIMGIDPLKDVDAFHPFNVGRLLIGKPIFEPCTPAGIVELLKYSHIETPGKHIVILGRSNIVGKPLAALLMQKGPFADATVTVCHSRTRSLETICHHADILVAAIGVAEFVKGHMIKHGSVVIDVGMNRIDDPGAPKGTRLVGDVDYKEASEIAGQITPVPGGVGPMTIAMLLKNTLYAAKRQ